MSIFSQLNFKHGAAKLQSASSSLLCLTSNDGGEILVQSAVTGDLIPIALSPGGINQELFNATASVMGTPNQTLAANTLYSVYLKNLDGLETGCVLDFWPTFSGYNPTLQANGMYIGNTGGPNIGLMYVGQIWTGSSNISTVISPADHMAQPCYSHFNPWTFGFQTNEVQLTSFVQANSGVQSTPSILTVTEGISECPGFTGLLNFYANTAASIGGYVTFYIQVSGTGINGSGGSTAWTVNSPVQFLTIKNDNTWYSLSAEWMSAPPIGVYTAKPYIAYTGAGSLTIHTSLLGKLSL